MKIKLHITERTIKLRNRKSSAEHLFRRANIRQMLKSTRENLDKQTIEGDDTETAADSTAAVLQRAAPLRRIQQLRRSKAKSKAQEHTNQPQRTQETPECVPGAPAEQPPPFSAPLQQTEAKTTAKHRPAQSNNTPAPQKILSESAHVHNTQVSMPKIKATARPSVRDAAATIQPKRAEHTVKQRSKVHFQKGTLSFSKSMHGKQQRPRPLL